ncbi:MAG: tRNA (guanosine(46)-N7)-methyltransferase TrmB [Sphaerochaetaceae bacterium]
MSLETDRVETVSENGRREIKSFVLRGGRLAGFQKEALELYADRYVIPFSPGHMDFTSIFKNDHPVIMEIGFGMGTSTERIAIAMPQYDFIGMEVFLNGFARLLHSVGTKQIGNLRLMRFDAVEVLRNMVPDGSISGFHIFFPDPWQKKRQWKRRLIQEPFAQLLASKLCPGGYIYCVTDWEEYALQMVEVFSRISVLRNPYGGFAPPCPWRPTTEFEKKGLRQNHVIREIRVERNS